MTETLPAVEDVVQVYVDDAVAAALLESPPPSIDVAGRFSLVIDEPQAEAAADPPPPPWPMPTEGGFLVAGVGIVDRAGMIEALDSQRELWRSIAMAYPEAPAQRREDGWEVERVGRVPADRLWTALEERRRLQEGPQTLPPYEKVLPRAVIAAVTDPTGVLGATGIPSLAEAIPLLRYETPEEARVGAWMEMAFTALMSFGLSLATTAERALPAVARGAERGATMIDDPLKVFGASADDWSVTLKKADLPEQSVALVEVDAPQQTLTMMLPTPQKAPSVDQVLMRLRDEATAVTRKFFSDEPMDPARFGSVNDAIFKSMVKEARDQGRLPATIRTSEASLNRPGSPGIDVWDTASGVGWHLTTPRQVAAHDIRYVGQLTPDGTLVVDVRPLVYLR